MTYSWDRKSSHFGGNMAMGRGWGLGWFLCHRRVREVRGGTPVNAHSPLVKKKNCMLWGVWCEGSVGYRLGRRCSKFAVPVTISRQREKSCGVSLGVVPHFRLHLVQATHWCLATKTFHFFHKKVKRMSDLKTSTVTSIAYGSFGFLIKFYMNNLFVKNLFW